MHVEPPMLRVVEGNADHNHPKVFIVNRNHDADQVVRNIQLNNFSRQNNIANMVEQILA